VTLRAQYEYRGLLSSDVCWYVHLWTGRWKRKEDRETNKTSDDQSCSSRRCSSHGGGCGCGCRIATKMSAERHDRIFAPHSRRSASLKSLSQTSAPGFGWRLVFGVRVRLLEQSKMLCSGFRFRLGSGSGTRGRYPGDKCRKFSERNAVVT